MSLFPLLTNALFNLSFPPRIKYGVNSSGNPEKGNGTGFLLPPAYRRQAGMTYTPTCMGH